MFVKFPRKKISYGILILSLLFIGLGILRAEHITVVNKAVRICLECIGVG